MDLEQLVHTVISSSRESWHIIPCWGAGSGPSYRSQFDMQHKFDGQAQQNLVSAVSHRVVASYKPDVAVTLAFGLVSSNDFKEAWATIFPNSRASAHHADLFYNGALVYRDAYVLVDGGKAKLPLPRRGMSVPKGYYYFVKLLDQLGGYASHYSSYFKRSDLTVVDAPWPEL